MKLSNIAKSILYVFGIWVMLGLFSVNVYAEEAVADLSKLMVTKTALDAYAEPSEQSEVVVSYEADASILITGETNSGWYRVTYQDKVGYVKKTALKETEIDIEALNEEFEAEEIEGKVFIEEVERVRAQISRSRIWGTIIIVLIIGIMGTGIYSTIMSERKKLEREKEDSHNEEKSEETTEQENKIPTLDVIDLDNQEL